MNFEGSDAFSSKLKTLLDYRRLSLAGATKSSGLRHRAFACWRCRVDHRSMAAVALSCTLARCDRFGHLVENHGLSANDPLNFRV